MAENGYTAAPVDQVKVTLDPESFELEPSRERQLVSRFNTLVPRAIGIRRGARGESSGWSVAFDYLRRGERSATCRVVTITDDGSKMVMQHVDGKRERFVGFE